MSQKKRFLIFSSLVALFSVFCHSQQQDTSGVKYGKVYVSGENPVLRLGLKQGEPFLTSVSFWRIVYSPAGMGHVCYVTSDVTGNGKSSDDIRAVFTDNEKLLEFMNKEIMTSAKDNAYPVRKAHFAKTGDSLKEWVEVVQSDDCTIVLIWKEFIEPFCVDTPIGGERPFGISSLCIPAKKAEVYINGVKAMGQPIPEMRGKMQNTSARLWLSETWVK